MTPFDLALFAWMSAGSSPNPWLLAFMSKLAQNGPLLCVAILAVIAWRKPSLRIYLLATLAACGVASLLAQALATAIDLPRPFMLGLSPDYIAHGARGAMPSAHATVMFTMAFALLFRRGLRSWGLAAAAVAAGTGFARVFVGVHFPFDIVAGLLLGALIAGALQLAVALGRRAWTRLGPLDPSAIAPPGAAGPRLSCVIPCFNQASHLTELLSRLEEALWAMHRPWEIIMVDDGSTDGTAAMAAEWCQLSGFRCVYLSARFGRNAATTAGLKASLGDAIVVFGDRLQQSPELIGPMFAQWSAGAAIVHAVPPQRQHAGTLAHLGAAAMHRLAQAMRRLPLPHAVTDCLMDRKAVDALLRLPERSRMLKSLVAWIGFDTVALACPSSPRADASRAAASHGLARLHDVLKRRPRYVVDKVLGQGLQI